MIAASDAARIVKGANRTTPYTIMGANRTTPYTIIGANRTSIELSGHTFQCSWKASYFDTMHLGSKTCNYSEM